MQYTIKVEFKDTSGPTGFSLNDCDCGRNTCQRGETST